MRSVRLNLLLLLLVLTTTVPLSLFAGYLAARTWRQQLATVERQTLDTARAILVAIDQEIDSTVSSLTILAALDLLDKPDIRSFGELATRLVQQRKWRAVHLAEPPGRLIMNTAGRIPRNDSGDPLEWASTVFKTRRAFISDLLQDPSTGEPYIVIAVPVVRNDKILLALAAQVPGAVLSDILQRQAPPPNGVVTLIDGTQRIVARSRNEPLYVGKPPGPGFIAAITRMREGSWKDVTLEGTPAYASMTRSSLTNWTVAIGLPTEEVDGPLRNSLWALAGGGLLTLIVGIGSALWLSWVIVRALASASIAARALAHEEPISARPSRMVEVEELSRAMSEAAHILKTRLLERNQASEERERALDAERSARAASAKAEARLSVTLRSIGDAVITTDTAGRITMVTPVAQALTGWSESEAIDQPIEMVFQIVNEQTREPLESPVVQVLRERRIVGLAKDTALVARDGADVPIEDSAAPIRTADGAFLGVVLVFRDVTEQRETERQRLALLEQELAARRGAEAASRSKDEFVATISHELRTPLGAILGWVQLLRAGKLDASARVRALDVIERNTRTQAQLIDDLLDTSRVVTGKLRLHLEPTNLVSVLDAAIDAVRPTAEAKQLTIDCNIDRNVAPILGDPERLQQIAWNLLSNSIKFTPEGGRIEVSLKTDGAHAMLRITDTGKGIVPELLPHIFERFRQGESSESRTHGGLGLGLALVRYLVEIHGGTVEAESAGSGQGAVFTVCLPFLKRAGDGAQDSMPATQAVADGRDALQMLQELRVLVVDDDADVRELVSTALAQAGAQATCAASVNEAVTVLNAKSFDVMISDIGMPNGSGYDLLRNVRESDRYGELPVIAFTAYARAEDRERALAAGFDFHVSKPVDPLVLLRVVATAAGRA